MALSCEGVFGSRMTGGGFGGCTVTLVRKENVDDVKNFIKVPSRSTFYYISTTTPFETFEIKPLNFFFE